MKRATAGRAARLVGTLIPTAVPSLAGIDLDGECLTYANSLTSDGPADGRLEHFLEDLVMVSGRALLRLAAVGEVGTKASKEAKIEAIHEGLTNTDGKQILVDEGLVLILAGAVVYGNNVCNLYKCLKLL